MSTRASGAPATVGYVCTRSFAMEIGCTSGISTGGHYLSEDGGETFRASGQAEGLEQASRRIRIPNLVSACTRSRGMTRHRAGAYMQNHGGWAEWSGPGGPRPDIGVLRSDDYGQWWRLRLPKGLPSDFGFPIVVHPHDADTVYVMPLRAVDAFLSRRRARGVAQRKWRRLVEPARTWAAEEARAISPSSVTQ